MDILHGSIAFGAAFIAGMINSVAGGGTLLTFPALVWVGLPPVMANATNTVAIWPGSLGGMWGYREELERTERRFLLMIAPSLIGGILGAALLEWTPPGVFAKLVPYLVLLATALFMAQEPIQRWLRRGNPSGPAVAHGAGAMIFQFFVALYGGYFGAGIGILMLAALGLMGLTEMNEMNALKNLFALCINGIASVYFVVAGMVYWPYVLLMAAGAIAGGYGSAGIARRLGSKVVRRIVIGIGFGMAISLFVKT